MLSSHKNKLGQASPRGTGVVQRLALHSSLREDGFPSPHKTEQVGLHHAFSGTMDTAFRGGKSELGDIHAGF